MRYALAFITALIAALVLTPAVIRLAHRYELVARPKESRWHSKPTALFGGVAIWIAFAIGFLVFARIHNEEVMRRLAGVLLGGSFMFLVGLVDDFLHLRPATKLVAQVATGCIFVYSGVYFDILGMPLVTIPLTVFWVVGVTNAFNLLDNMDGLATGIGLICAATIFALNVLLGIDSNIGLMAIAFCGALLGFLVFNFNPARIFMGDCGSMMIGSTLAGLSIVGTWQQASNTFLVLLVPVLLLGLPIFDTAFVTVTRHLSGRPLSVGGKDHTSHRLVALGLSERRAVVLLYAICAMFGAIAVLSLRFELATIGTLIILAAIVVLIFGIFLGQSRLYQEVKADRRPTRRRGFVFGTFVMYKQQMVEVLIDVLLFGAAFLSAYLIRFDGVLSPLNERLLLFALPIVIPVKLVTFWLFGLYKRVWDFVGIQDLVAIAKAVLTSTLVSIMLMWGVTRLQDYSRLVFLLDGILLLLFTAGSRVLYRVFKETLRGETSDGRRLLIVGAGQAGEMVLREVKRDPTLGYRPVGFVDDDPDKRGRRIHGFRIFGGRENIASLAESDRFDEIVIAIPSLSEPELSVLMDACRATGKTTRVMQSLMSTFLN